MKPATCVEAHPFDGYNCERRLVDRQVYIQCLARSIAALSKIKSFAALTFRPTHRRLPSETVLKQDWHNELTQFTFDLRDLLEQAADEKSRAKIMRRMQRALQGET